MPTLADVQQTLSQQAHKQLTNQALTSAAQIGVGALGAGMMGRGLLGVLQHIRRQRVPPRSTIPSPIEVEIPVEEINDEKMAGILDTAISGAAGVATDFGKGLHATTQAGVPWSQPLWYAAGIGGLGAGWKLTDYLMDKRRKKHQQTDFDAAKKEYNDALYGKTASLLDELFDATEPVAEKKADVSKILSFLRGLRPSVAGRRAMFALRPAFRSMQRQGAGDTYNNAFQQGVPAAKDPGYIGHLFGQRPLAELGNEAGVAAENAYRRLNPASSFVRSYQSPWLGKSTREIGQDAAQMQMAGNIGAGVGGGGVAGIATAMEMGRDKQSSAEDFQPSSLTPGNLAGMAGGLAATWAGGSGLLAALSTYEAMKKRQRKSLLSAAQEQRRRQRYEAQPTPVYATPVPVSIMEAEDEAKPFRAAPSLH